MTGHRQNLYPIIACNSIADYPNSFRTQAHLEAWPINIKGKISRLQSFMSLKDKFYFFNTHPSL